MIRAAREDDLPVLRDVERAAGRVFRDIGMTLVADDERPSLDALRAFQGDGRAWVSDVAVRPVAYLLASGSGTCPTVI